MSARYCRQCGKLLPPTHTRSATTVAGRLCQTCSRNQTIVEPENGRWWRELLSPEAKAYVETNYPENDR